MKNKGQKQFILFSLIASVIALTICSLSYSKSVRVLSEVKVKPNITSEISFSSSEEEIIMGDIKPIISSTSMNAPNATISRNDATMVTNLSANFTEPGQSVTYIFYVVNSSKYKANLNKVIFDNVNGRNMTKECIPSINSNIDKVNVACNYINMKLDIREEKNITQTSYIYEHKLNVGEAEPISITLSYDKDSPISNQNFEVNFGNIRLDYSLDY